MSANRLVVVLAAILFAGAGSPALASSAPDERVDRLSSDHKTWLQEEVVYIISDREREVFLELASVEERLRFIEAFWRKRDPNPATPINEYKVEHYRRVDYANTYLGRDTFREGWQTDRGRFYIILGEPRDIQRFDGYAEVVSAHLWFYQGNPRLGTPSFFYLLFFKKDDFGEFQLYHPVIDGPQALLRGSLSIPTSDNRPAIQSLREVSAELAQASLSFDPSEPADLAGGRAAIGTDIMIARIEQAPKRVVRTDYADAWLRYGNRVSGDYSFNFIPSRNAFSILADPSGASLVHYSIEIDPEHFSVETDEDNSTYYTTLDVSVEARTPDGRLVYAADKEAFVELSPSQMLELRSRPFAYQDDFVLVPGDYTVSAILRNRVLRQYTVAERELHVPSLDPTRPTLIDVVLAFETESRPANAVPGRVATFQLGELRLHPAAESLFVIGDTVHLVAQAFGAGADHRVVFDLLQDGDVLRTLESAASPNALVVDYLSLDDMVGGEYEVRARLVAPGGETLSEKSVPLVVSPRSVASRPGYVYRRGLNTGIPGLVDFMRGEQLTTLDRSEEAVSALEAAVAAGNPRLVPARWMLAHAYLRRGRTDEALTLLRPLEETHGSQFEVVAGLGLASYLKDDFESAVAYLTRARELRPPNTSLLNALGDSHQRLGDADAAREAFSRSLELDADQPEVRERITALGGSPSPH